MTTAALPPDEIKARVLAYLDRVGPSELAALQLAATAPVGHVHDVLRVLADVGKVKLTKVTPAGVQSRTGCSARLVWHLPEHHVKPIASMREGLTVVPQPTRKRRRARRLDPHSNSRPEPIEILARMAGRTNFLTPKSTASSTATVPVTPIDIAHAIATAPDKVGGYMALAMACQRPDQFHKLEKAAHLRVLTQLREQKKYPRIVAGARKFIAYYALVDAFEYLIAPQSQPTWAEGAKRRRLRRDVYKFIVQQAIGVLENAANTAAKDAVDFLFASEFASHLKRLTARPKGKRDHLGAVMVRNGGIDHYLHKSADELRDEHEDAFVFDLADLLEKLLNHPRAAGVLSLTRPE